MLLIIFTKNMIEGKVKTRLASKIGNMNALIIYQHLLKHTVDITEKIEAEKWVYYSDHIENNDLFNDKLFNKKVQKGEDLGQRMMNAFKEGFESGYRKILLIGSDCFELETEIITNAFEMFDNADAVLGPAFDGGYYLIGLKHLFEELFINKKWSTDTVLHDTLEDFNEMHIRYNLLPPLSDVDEIEDLPEELKKYINQ